MACIGRKKTAEASRSVHQTPIEGACLNSATVDRERTPHRRWIRNEFPDLQAQLRDRYGHAGFPAYDNLPIAVANHSWPALLVETIPASAHPPGTAPFAGPG